MTELIIVGFVIGIFILVPTYRGIFRQSRIGCSHLIIAPTVKFGEVHCYCGLIKSEDNPCTYATCPIVKAKIV